MVDDREEQHDQLKTNPELAADLEQRSKKWAAELQPAGVPNEIGNIQEVFFYNHYFDVPLPVNYKPTQTPFK